MFFFFCFINAGVDDLYNYLPDLTISLSHTRTLTHTLYYKEYTAAVIIVPPSMLYSKIHV